MTARATYFLSDLHIASPHEARTERLLAFLHELKGQAEAIYLVGDVFDFWLGYSSVISKEFFPVLRTFSEIVESGTKLTIFSGNHDPDPGAFLSDLGVQIEERPKAVRVGDHSVWLEHGDTIDPRSAWKRVACHMARNRIFRRAARLVHPDIAWGLSRAYAHKKETYEDPLPKPLLDDYFPARVADGHDVVVIGHYHRAVNHRAVHHGKSAQFYALGDWVQQKTYLKYDGQFQLMRDLGPDKEPRVLGAGDHGPDAAP